VIAHSERTAYGEVVAVFTGARSGVAGTDNTERYRSLLTRFPQIAALAYSEQVHGDAVLTVTKSAGDLHFAGEGDALLTNEAGHALLIRTADCIPILFYSVSSPLAGAVHAGWRGLEKKILTKVVRSLREKSSDLRFVVGPFIGERSYEVGSDVAAQFDARHSEAKPADKFYLNLRTVLEDELAALQIEAAQVTWFAHDTLSNAEWYSARRGDSDRNFSVIYFSV